MTTKTIAHALFSWTEHGTTRLAVHGETVDIDDAVAAEYERFGVFFAPEPEPAPFVPTPEPAPAAPEPVKAKARRPKNVATEQVWRKYAIDHGIDTDGMTKDEIIEHFTEQENTNG